jgi:hypothetical protein
MLLIKSHGVTEQKNRLRNSPKSKATITKLFEIQNLFKQIEKIIKTEIAYNYHTTKKLLKSTRKIKFEINEEKKMIKIYTCKVLICQIVFVL